MTTYNVWVGDIQFNWKYADRGYFYKILAGWNDLADVRGKRDAVPGAHGLYPAVESWRTGASITINGSIMGTSRADAEYLRDQLITGLSSASVMRVEDSTGAWSRDIEVDNVSIKDPGGWSPIIHFVVDVLAADPSRYRDPVSLGPVGLPVRSGGLVLPSAFPWNFGTSIRPTLEIVNTGSLPAYPIVRVSGSGSSLSVMGGPRRVEFGAWAGEFVIDNRQRRAFLNGADVTRQLTRRDWQQVPVGQTYSFSFDAPGSSDAQMTVDYRIGVW